MSHEELRVNHCKSLNVKNPVIEPIKAIEKELKFNYKYSDNLYDELYVGDLVTRGNSWCYDLDDGAEGSIGTVLAVDSQGFGLVIVRWKGNYDYFILLYLFFYLLLFFL